MSIPVYLDNNVWDFLLERKLDLGVELPHEEFCIYITREAEFEILLMPPNKRIFAEDTIAKYGIRTDALFGFYNDKYLLSEQRVRGWNQGRWASQQELAFMNEQVHRLGSGKDRPTRLHQYEADIALAARSFHGVVLSLDARRGPLRDAYNQGGKIVFLTDFDDSGLSLSDFISRAVVQTLP